MATVGNRRPMELGVAMKHSLGMSKKRRLSERVRALLEERGWSQAVLADLARVNPGHLSRLLSGRRRWSLPYLERVARAFERDPVEFAADTSEADLVRPNGGVIDREYAEKLGTDLAETAARVQEVQAELAAVQETASKLEGELRVARNAREQAERQRDDASRAAQAMRQRLEPIQRELADTQALLESTQTAERQHRHQIEQLRANLSSAHRQIVVNYDAWKQADARAQSLAQQLGAQGQQTAGAALFAGLIGLGIGVASKSK
jgi:transcriptional regulator with XRE-family HTH domain